MSTQSLGMGTKPLFTREQLMEVDHAASQGHKSAAFVKLFGPSRMLDDMSDPVEEIYSNTPGEFEVRRILFQYSNYQRRNDPNTNPQLRQPITVMCSRDTYMQLTLSDLRLEHDCYKHEWETSDECKALKHQLFSAHSLDTESVHKVICFGLGSFSIAHNRSRKRAHIQTAATETIISMLRDTNHDGKHIACFSQDPAYTKTDKEFLLLLGITPLEDPKGFLEIDKNTLVYTVSPNVPVRQMVAALQWPAGLICKPIVSEEEELTQLNAKWASQKKPHTSGSISVVHSTDPTSQHVMMMVKDCYILPFPESQYFSSLAIYLRKNLGYS